MSDRAILFEESRESAHLCLSVVIIIARKRLYPDSIRYSIRFRIVAADSIRDSIRTKISESKVPTHNISLQHSNSMDLIFLQTDNECHFRSGSRKASFTINAANN